MYPQDEQPQPPNQNLMGQAPQPFNYGRPVDNGPKKKKSLAWLPWAVSGFMFLLVIIFGIIVLANSGNKDNNPNNGTPGDNGTAPNDTTLSDCTSKQRRYQSKDLDIRFCYPTGWGDVKVSDSKLDPSDGGTRFKLTFADKASVVLGLVSDDWATDSGMTPSCKDPSIQAFPDTSTFSAKWVTEKTADGQVTSALRGLDVVPDSYLLQEEVDNTTLNGVCLEGYKAFGGDVYRNAEATIYAAFAGKVTSPQAHITSPTQLISVPDRTDFTDFVKSIEKY